MELGMVFLEPVLHRFRGQGKAQDGVIAQGADLGVRPQVFLEGVSQAEPVKVRPFFREPGIEAQLPLGAGQGIGEDGQTRRIRPPFGHADEHRHHQLPQLFAQGGLFHQ